MVLKYYWKPQVNMNDDGAKLLDFAVGRGLASDKKHYVAYIICRYTQIYMSISRRKVQKPNRSCTSKH